MLAVYEGNIALVGDQTADQKFESLDRVKIDSAQTILQVPRPRAPAETRARDRYAVRSS